VIFDLPPLHDRSIFQTTVTDMTRLFGCVNRDERDRPTVHQARSDPQRLSLAAPHLMKEVLDEPALAQQVSRLLPAGNNRQSQDQFVVRVEKLDDGAHASPGGVLEFRGEGQLVEWTLYGLILHDLYELLVGKNRKTK
jgi:hypothetical protein